MGQQWPATGTGALAAADLGGTAFETHHKATEQTTHKLENNYTKEFLAVLQKFYGPQLIYAISAMKECEQSLEQLKHHQL